MLTIGIADAAENDPTVTTHAAAIILNIIFTPHVRCGENA
jgi:hypothetical protein